MKILHINGYFKEDVVYQENLLTLGQKELGHEVILLTSCYEPEMKVNFGNRRHKPGVSNYKGIKVIRVDDYMEVKKNALVLLKNLIPIFKQVSPDIIFFHDVSPNIFYGIIYKFFNPKVVFHIDFHSDEFNARNSKIGPIYHWFWKVFFWIFRKKFDRYFGVAPEAVSFVHKFYSIPLKDIILLPLPGDSSVLNKYDLYRKEIRSELKLNDNIKVIAHTGKMPQDKETLLVLKSFTEMKDANMRLVIAGSIDLEFEDVFNKYLRADDRIIFLGWLNPEQMRKLFCGCDVLIQPGSLSHIFIEAICCGLPVILNNTPQGRYLTSFKNGELVEKKSSECIIQTINQVLEDEKLSSYKHNSIQAAEYFHYVNNAKISLE
jgi:glycosyltransferase involved in cell wall biosynthesis